MRIPCLALCTLLVTTALGQELAAELQAAVDARVARAIEEQEIVGMAVCVAQNGALAYTGCYGWADRENELPVTPATRFRWASISKPLTAVVALQLWEAELLDLDADVCSYLPEFPAKPFPISARQLLCHQGGIVHYSNGPVIRSEVEYESAHPFEDMVVALDTFKESPLVHEPGTAYSYTTHGYILLGAVVQRAGEQPYASQVQERIADVLGMDSLEPDYQWLELPERAVGYRYNLARRRIRSGDNDVSWKLPGGGFLSNVEDLARFGLGMLSGALLARETRDLVWTRQATADGTRTGYGLGFSISKRPRLLVGHSGAQQKTSTYLTIDPKSGTVIAIMSNTEGLSLGKLGRDLVELCAPE